MGHPQILAPRTVSLLSMSALLLLGCQRDGVRRYRIAKEAAPAAVANPEPQATAAANPEPRATAGGLRWTLPEGWTHSEGDGMRYATLKPSTPGTVDISVVTLSGAAGGELANVNRWRQQMGLPPVPDETTLATLRKTAKTSAGDVALFDFTSSGGPKNRMVVGLLSAPDGNSWFMKMTGDEAAVAQAQKEFLEWIGSLRFE